MSSAFIDLAAYQLAAALGHDLHAAVTRWPPAAFWSTGIQLIRSADSIGANIAEGCGRVHTPDRRRFYAVARGSLYETEHWIMTAETRGLLGTGFAERLDEVARTLNGLIRAAS